MVKTAKVGKIVGLHFPPKLLCLMSLLVTMHSDKRETTLPPTQPSPPKSLATTLACST